MGGGGKSDSGGHMILLNHADAEAFLKGELKTEEYQQFCKRMADVEVEVNKKQREAGVVPKVQLLSMTPGARGLAATEDKKKDDAGDGTENAAKDVSAYIQAMNTMTMHAAVMNQAPTVGKKLGKQLPKLQEHLDTAKNNANHWQDDIRPTLSKIVTDFIDSSNQWEEYVEYMAGEAEDAKDRSSKATDRAEKDQILQDLKDELADVFADLQNDVDDKQTRIAGAVIELGNLIKLLNVDVANFAQDNKEADVLIGTKENPGLLDQMDKAIDAQQKRVDTDIGLIVGGSIAAAGAIIGGIAIVVVTGGIGTGAAIALGAVALSGAGAITYGAVDLHNAYNDLANALAEKTTIQQDAILLKTNQASIQTYKNSATMAASALLVIEGTWRSFGDLLDVFAANVQKAKDANSVISEFLKIRVAVRSLNDVKEFSLNNLVPTVGVLSYEEALQKQQESAAADKTVKSRAMPLLFAAAVSDTDEDVSPDHNGNDGSSTKLKQKPKYNVLSANFAATNVAPMTSNALQLTAIGIGIDQQERLYVDEVPNFVQHQQNQVKNADTAIGTIAPLYRSALGELQDFSNAFAVSAEAVEARDVTLEEVAPFLLSSLDQTTAKFENVKSKIEDLQTSQTTVTDQLEIDLTIARSKLIDPQGKVSQLSTQMDGIRDSLDITNGKIADTMLQQGLTNFIDDLSLGLGWGLTSYTTKGADFGAAQKWDQKKQAVGQLSSMGDSASKIPNISEFTQNTNALLRQYGQAMTASLVAQSNYTAISDAYKSGKSMLHRLSLLGFYLDRFIHKLGLLKDQMSYALKDIEGSPETLVDKIIEANKSWVEAKKLCSAAQRLSIPSQTPTTFIEVTKEEIEKELGEDSEFVKFSKQNADRGGVMLRAFGVAAIPAATQEAKREAADVSKYCEDFKAMAIPGSSTEMNAALKTFMDGLGVRRTKMQSTESALQQQSHELNLKVSQLKGEQSHIQAQLAASQQVVNGMKSELSKQQSEYRTKKTIYDALMIPTFGLSKLIEQLDEAITRTKARLDQEMRRLYGLKAKMVRMQQEYEQVSRETVEATKTANQTLNLYYKLGTTIDLTSNAIKDKPSSIAKVAYKIALRGADDIIAYAKNF